jgi:hypothetical protein
MENGCILTALNIQTIMLAFIFLWRGPSAQPFVRDVPALLIIHGASLADLAVPVKRYCR